VVLKKPRGRERRRERRERETGGPGGGRAVPSRELSNLDHEVYVIERLEPVVWT
jgi:hypothetical protein